MTSISCIFGTAASNALLFSLTCVACSYANAYLINSNSVHAVPMNASPNGMPGALVMIGSAGPGTKPSGANPSGTERYEVNQNQQNNEHQNLPVTRG